MSDLHISIIRGEYNGVPVEIKEFFGGSDDKLTEVRSLFARVSVFVLNYTIDGERTRRSLSDNGTVSLFFHLELVVRPD